MTSVVSLVSAGAVIRPSARGRPPRARGPVPRTSGTSAAGGHQRPRARAPTTLPGREARGVSQGSAGFGPPEGETWRDHTVLATKDLQYPLGLIGPLMT